MPGISAERDESIDSVLRSFKKQVGMEGVLSEVRKGEFYEKSSERMKKRILAAKNRVVKKVKKL